MYMLKLGPQLYEGYRDGTPFTLVDCFREARGVGQATILTTTGRVVLRNAGSLWVRSHLREERRQRRTETGTPHPFVCVTVLDFPLD
jgi:hypothetical protein